MTRKKTNPFVARHLLAKIEKVNMKEEKETIVTWSRASSILPAMVGHTIAIHNEKGTYTYLHNKSYGRSQIGGIRAYSAFHEL